MDRKAIKGNFDSNADERQTDALWALYEAAERAVNECVDLYSVLQKNRKSISAQLVMIESVAHAVLIEAGLARDDYDDDRR